MLVTFEEYEKIKGYFEDIVDGNIDYIFIETLEKIDIFKEFNSYEIDYYSLEYYDTLETIEGTMTVVNVDYISCKINFTFHTDSYTLELDI